MGKQRARNLPEIHTADRGGDSEDGLRVSLVLVHRTSPLNFILVTLGGGSPNEPGDSFEHRGILDPSLIIGWVAAAGLDFRCSL